MKERVRKVVISDRLTKSPAALVAGTYGLTANMERIVRSQALGEQDPSLAYQPKPVLEININHPILKSLRSIAAADEKDPVAVDTANVLFESAAVASGYGINDPQGFVQRMNRVLSRSLEHFTPTKAASNEGNAKKASDEKEL